MRLTGRILWLTDDGEDIRRQLTGAAIYTVQDSPPLKYGVNTDAMISGAACTLGYTPEVLGPHLLRDYAEAVRENDILGAKIQVIVGGDAYGSGSSREVAVVAHQGAGVELVIARSFQRIFQENMVYAGLPFTTDFSVAETLADGGEVDTDALSDELPAFFRDVASSGGLLGYADLLMAASDDSAVIPAPISHVTRPLNCVEKIIALQARHSLNCPPGVSQVAPGDQVLCDVDFRGMHEYTTAMVLDLYERQWGETPLCRASSVAAFEDHFVLLGHSAVPKAVQDKRLVPAQRLAAGMSRACERFGIRRHAPDSALSSGVCHRIVVEEYAKPGTIVVLTDSHTPTAGVLNTFAFGVGSTAMAFALRTGLIPVTVPKTVRVVISGQPRAGLSPKDVILHLIGDPYFREEHWRNSPTDTCVVQFGGEALERWSVDELSVLTNMTVEGGLMTGIVEPCGPAIDFVRSRQSESSAGDQSLVGQFVEPDSGATYERTINVDLGEVPLTVATPGDSRNRQELRDSRGIPIHNVVIASCTGGSLVDLRAAADIFRGRELHHGVRLTVTPSSDRVAKDAEQAGIMEVFRQVGATITAPGCGSCIGNGPGIPMSGETTVSTTNRNFDRRMGAPGPVYLASPAVAAASAVCGKLTDPNELGG